MMKISQTIKKILNNPFVDRIIMLAMIGLFAIIAPFLAYILLIVWGIIAFCI